MRNTDDLQDREPFRPLGQKVEKPAKEVIAPKPQGSSGIVADADGKLRTTSHKPHLGTSLEAAIWQWVEMYNLYNPGDSTP